MLALGQLLSFFIAPTSLVRPAHARALHLVSCYPPTQVTAFVRDAMLALVGSCRPGVPEAALGHGRSW